MGTHGYQPGCWGTSRAHGELKSPRAAPPPSPSLGWSDGAVHLRVAAALFLNYCSAGPWVAAVAPPLSSLFFFFGLSLIRIPLVRWSLGFDPKGLPESVFGLGFGLGRGSSRGGPLFWPVGRHTLLRLQRIQGGCAMVHGYLVDALK